MGGSSTGVCFTVCGGAEEVVINCGQPGFENVPANGVLTCLAGSCGGTCATATVSGFDVT